MRELKIAGVAVTRDKTDQLKNNPRWPPIAPSNKILMAPCFQKYTYYVYYVYTFHMYLVGLHIFMGHYYKYIGWVAK